MIIASLEDSWDPLEVEKAMDVLQKLCCELLDSGHPPEMVSDIVVLWSLEIHTPSCEPPLLRLGRNYFLSPPGEA